MRLHVIAPATRMARHGQHGKAGQMIAIALAVAALVAALAAVGIALLRAGIAREESDHSLLADPATRAASVTRRLVGLYVRTPDRAADAGRFADQDAQCLARRPPRRPSR